MSNTIEQAFDTIYETDLVYVEDCWKLCGDAHCCHFSRYRQQGPEKGIQTIPMLTGEYAYLEKRGLLAQYPEHSLGREEIKVPGQEAAPIVFEMLQIQTQGCPCEHATRPTMCRLYPIMPVFSLRDGLIGIDTDSSPFEIVEDLGKIPRACQVNGTSFEQWAKFMRICEMVRGTPALLLSLMAYSLAQKVFRSTLEETMKTGGVSVFVALGGLGDQAVNQEILAAELSTLYEDAQAYYGEAVELI